MRLAVRPSVQPLEDRTTPATFFVDPALSAQNNTFNAGQPNSQTVAFGTTGFATISAALAAAQANPGGDTILLANKTIPLNNSGGQPVVLTSTNPLTITAGTGTGFTAAATVLPSASTANDTTSVLQVNGTNATLDLSNIVFNGNSPTFNIGRYVQFTNGAVGVLNNDVFQNVAFANGGNPGIPVTAQTGSVVTVQNSQFSNYGNAGVSASNSDLIVQNSRFTGGGALANLIQYGVQVANTTAANATHTIINANTFTNFTGSTGPVSMPTNSAGVFIFTTTATEPIVQVYGNNFSGNRVGVLVDSNLTTGVDATGVLIFANNFSGGAAPAIAASTSDDGFVQAANNNYGGSAPVVDGPNGISSNVATGASFLTTAAPNNIANTPEAYAIQTGIATTVVFVNATPLPPTAFGVQYNQVRAATGGVAPYSYTLRPGAGDLPAGITLNPLTGAIAGTSTTTGSFQFVVEATDSTGLIGAQSYQLDVFPNPVLTPVPLPGGGTGAPYFVDINAVGSPGPFRFTLSFGNLPPGLSLDQNTGVLSGTPPAGSAATYSFSINATDLTTGGSTTQPYQIVIGALPVISPATLPNATAGVAYNATVSATGTPGPYTFTVTTGTLPAGLQLNSSTGVITGTPSTNGTSTFTISARDQTDQSVGTKTYTVTVGTPIVISPATLPNGVVGTAYNQTVSATGGTAPFTFAVSAGNLPAGLSLNANTGAITGTPTAQGASTFTIRATDSRGVIGTQQYTLTVTTTPVPPPPPPLPTLPSVYAVGQDTGGGTVNVYNAAGNVTSTISPFGSGYTAGVRTAVADVNGDGTPDLIVASGPGVPVGITIYNGTTSTVLATLNPFELGFLGGAYVTAGDITGDGVAEIVVTPDQSGGPRVVVFRQTSPNTFTQFASFLGIDDSNFRGGVRAAVTDVNGDGTGDLIVAAGFGGGPRVAVFNGKTVGTGSQPTKLFNDFFAFDPSLRDGIYVAGGDINADGFGDIVTGGGPGGGPRVQTLSGSVATTAGGINLSAPPAGLVLSNFFAGDPNNRGGIRVATKNLNADANADLVTGSGQGAGSRTTTYLGNNLVAGNTTANTSFDAFSGFTGGVFVG